MVSPSKAYADAMQLHGALGFDVRIVAGPLEDSLVLWVCPTFKCSLGDRDPRKGFSRDHHILPI